MNSNENVISKHPVLYSIVWLASLFSKQSDSSSELTTWETVSSDEESTDGIVSWSPDTQVVEYITTDKSNILPKYLTNSSKVTSDVSSNFFQKSCIKKDGKYSPDWKWY